VIIVRDDEDVLRDELKVLVEEWGVTSCKVFMTYEAMRLGDGELLDVMLACRKEGVTTVSEIGLLRLRPERWSMRGVCEGYGLEGDGRAADEGIIPIAGSSRP
jgi:hypothetical protein